MSFQSFATAAEMRDVIEKIAIGTVKKMRPETRIAKVVSVNTSALTAEVTFSGDTGSINARFGLSLIPRSVGVIVRVQGKPGDYYITEILNDTGAHASYEPIKEEYDAGTLGGPPTGGWPATDIADGAITRIKLGDQAVNSDKIADGAVSSVKVSDGAISELKLAADAVTAAKIATGAVLTAKLADNAVSLAKLAANSVDNTKLVDAAVTAAKVGFTIGGGNLLGDSSFEAGMVGWTTTIGGRAAGSFNTTYKFLGTRSLQVQPATNGDLMAAAFPQYAVKAGWTWTTSAYVKVLSGTENAALMSMSGETATYITTAPAATYTASAVGNVDAGDGWRRIFRTFTFTSDGNFRASVRNSNSTRANDSTILVDAAQIERGDVVTAYAPKPDEILPNTITVTEIADNAITSPKIIAGAIVTSKIAADAITANEIAANAVTATEIAAGAVVAGKIAADAVTATTIAAGAVVAGKIAADAVTATEIAANAVTANEIAANAVTATQINAGAVTTAKIAAGAVTATEIASGAITTNKLSVIMGGGNLLANSGFESSTALASWTTGGAVTATVDAAVKFQGSQSAKLVCSTANADTCVSQTYAGILPNTKYTVSGWLYVDAISAGAVLNRSIFVSDTIDQSSFDTSLTGSHPVGVWTRKTATITTGPTATSLLVRAYAPQGTVHWDGIQLEAGDVPTAYNPKVDEILPGTITAAMIQAGSINIGGGGPEIVFQPGYDPSTKATITDLASTDAKANTQEGYAPNPYFDKWAGGAGSAPDNYITNAGVPVKETTIVRTAPFSLRYNVTAATDNFIQPSTLYLGNTDFLTVTADVYLVSGDWNGSGILCRWRNTGGGTYDGIVSFSSVLAGKGTGAWYRVQQVVPRPSGFSGTFQDIQVWPMGGWSGIQTVTAKNIIFDQMNARSSTVEEIKAWTAGLWTYPGTTKINGGMIQADTVIANVQISSPLIYSGYFSTASNGSNGERVIMRNDGTGGIIEFFTGYSGEVLPSVVDPSGTPSFPNQPVITMKSGTTSTFSRQATVQLISLGTGGGGSNGQVNINADTFFAGGASYGITGQAVSGILNLNFPTINSLGNHVVGQGGAGDLTVTWGKITANGTGSYLGGTVSIGNTLLTQYIGANGGDGQVNFADPVDLQLHGIAGIGGSGLDVSAGGLRVAGGGIATTGGGDINANAGALRGTDLYVTGATTTTNAINTNLNSAGGRILRSTASSERVKTNIRLLEDVDEQALRVIELVPTVFNYIIEHYENPDEDVPGIIAERAWDLGLEFLVQLDEHDGIETFRYDRLPIYHQLILRKHAAEIAELKAELKKINRKAA